MSDIVALTAFRELGHNAGRMRRTMAVLAVGHHFVLRLMAESAFEGLVPCLTGAEKVEGLLVTCAAVFGRDIRSIGHSLRHVRLMAFPAVGGSHFSRVRFVALGALRDLLVDAVTGGTVQVRMLAFVVPELGNLLCMAGEAGICDIACK